MTMTITEALAETKTIAKRLEKKREFVESYLWRQDIVKDPHENNGGSRTVIERERQAIADLEARLVAIRIAIARANDSTNLRVGDREKTIAEWLVWRREVAPGSKQFLERMRQRINNMRNEARQKGVSVRQDSVSESGKADIIVNVDEDKLAQAIESTEEVLGTLDGMLSLKNATTMVDV